MSPSQSWNSFTPKATLDYKVTEDAMVYVSYSEGFKSGGFNGSASSEAAALRGFDPEKAKQWEVGLKSMWLDGQVRLNLTAFHIDYTDLQVFQLVNGAELVIDNAADATSKGFEAELTAALTKELTFNANYAYLDASYSSYITEDGEDFSGNRLTRSPEHSFNIAMTYQRDLGDWGVLTLQGDYAYRDEIFFNPDNFRLDDGRILVGDGSRSLLDAYVALEFVQQGLEVKLWGKNLTDELYRVHGIDGRGPFGLTNSAAVVYGLPRSYGVTVTWQFN